MTEKQYGGASSFGFKDKASSTKGTSGAVVVKSSRENSFKNNENLDGISKETLKNYIKAGEISIKVKEYLKEIVKKDVLVLEIADKIEEKIKELGGEVAFPINISIDEIAAHYTPSARDETRASGLIKIDVGIEVGGFISDSAVSFDLTDDQIYIDMINVNKLALDSALEELKIGSPLKVIGNTISEVVEKDGRFKIIRNLTGHGLDKDNIHAGITVSNLKNESNFVLKDMAIAIEPFLTTGAGEIFEGKPSEIYILQNEKLPRDRDARKMLEFILENYRTKPFCKKWIERSGLAKPNYCLSVLVKEGILYNFPVLIEKDKKPVSQAEHTVVFADKVYVTTRGS